MSGHDILEAALREDLSSFIQKAFQVVSPADTYKHNWHIDLIADQLERCYRGEIKRLIITVPPRSLKSICASAAFPAWVLGKDPSRKIICASYSSELASKLARDCRAVMDTEWCRRVFPGTRLNLNAELNLETTQRGVRYATSVGGTLTGIGGNIVIIDDPLKSEDALSAARRETVKQWYDGTLYSRLNNKAEDVIIMIMQRLHMDDLVAHVLEKEEWVHLNLPAIAETDQAFRLGGGQVIERREGDVLHPGHEPRPVLDAIKSTIGSFKFAAQYQQNQVPAGGNLIQFDWFPFYDALPSRQPGDRVVQSWDTATKTGELNDYSVCVTVHIQGNEFYILDVLRERLIYPDLKRKVIDHALAFKAKTILVEDSASGTSLIQDISQMKIVGLPKPIAIRPEGEKAMRMSAQSSKIEAGQVFLPERASWIDEFRTEILAFPYGRYDDQVDALSQLLNWIDWRRRNRVRCGSF